MPQQGFIQDLVRESRYEGWVPKASFLPRYEVAAEPETGQRSHDA